MRWPLRPAFVKPPSLGISSQRQYSNLYEVLSLSLGVKSEQEERLQGLLSRDPTDTKNIRKVQQHVQMMAKSTANKSDLINKFSADHKPYAGPITTAIMLELIFQRSPQIASAYQSLVQNLGYPSNDFLCTLLTAAIIDTPQSYMPSVLEFFAKIPDYLLSDLANVWVPRWLELDVPSANLDLLIKAAARRGVFATKSSGYRALNQQLQKPIQVLEYVMAVRIYLSGLTAYQVVPQLEESFAVLIARKLRSLPPQMHPEKVLLGLVNEIKRLRPLPGRSAVLGSRFWAVAKKLQLEDPNPTIPTTIDECYEQINVLTASWKSGKRSPKTPKHVAQLYSQILSRYALYEPESLETVYAKADAACNQLFGLETAGNRRRRWLTSILSTFVHAEQYQKALKYVPDIQRTKTPYLWGLAIVSLAKTGHLDPAWDLTKTAFSTLDESLPSKVGVVLLQQLMHEKSPRSLGPYLSELQSYSMTFSDKQLAQILHYAGSGGSRYRWHHLRELLSSITDVLLDRDIQLRATVGGSHWRRPHNIYGVVSLKEIVCWGFLKAPLQPWCSIELIKGLKSRGVAIDAPTVQEAVSSALKELQHSKGEAVRVRQQCPHNMSVISEQFAKLIEELY